MVRQHHPRSLRPAPSDKPYRAIVIGGSLGGLFTANLLRRIGWDVDVFERSARALDSRGGGVVLQPKVRDVFRTLGLPDGGMGVRSVHRTVFHPDGSIRHRSIAPQVQTSWSMIYNAMHDTFGDAHYHRSKVLVELARCEAANTVTARFDDGSVETGDLLVGADGNGSTVRSLLWPDALPRYAGYLAWRGLVPEGEMPVPARQGLHGDFAFASNDGSHILGYLVPGEGNDTRTGHRLYNWVWYRTADDAELGRIMTDRHGRERGHSIPEGLVTDAWTRQVHDDASRLLPPAFASIVRATSTPFAQAIRDLAVDTMVKGRVVLLGDAAFIPRPHTAASTAKAATNALELTSELARSDDVDAALARWNPRQLQVGRFLHDSGRRIGDALLFHATPERPTGPT